MEVRRPSVPLLLLMLISFLAGIVISQAPTPHRPVNGILGGSVVLSVDLSPGKNVNKIEWSFHAGSGVTIQLAEINGGKFERTDPNDRFQQRLERYNETSLRIKALELGDSGVYEARIRIVPATMEELAFLLAVYEPVPTPEIKSHLLSSTAAGCNVTLQCQVSGREEVNVSWSRGNPPRDLGDPKRYQLSPDGRTFHLSLQPNLMNSTFTCTASNPMDQQSISLDLQSICQSRDTATDTAMWMGPLCVGLIIITAACVGMWLWKKRRKKPVGQAAVPTVPEEEECLSEPHYAEIKRRSPPEGDDQDPGFPSERTPITTIYDQIRVVPAGPSEQVT
ncbi:signaling lymphocytic activation molecule-like [Malaclemys terrapin pileata]|uniref:signaling lymphocytic activation molecule-like n=1 Tax=Malaclemys terrapin pileata TaxID=2991368 RepID=UPI0023A7FD09|nr:signaling lymphocytic activation molecule-like [Malaclemys terrapin pileata]